MRTCCAVLKVLSAGLLLGLGLLLWPEAASGGPDAEARAAFERYREVISRTAGMVHDAEAVALARKCELSVLNITWEDAGRYKHSAVGPNISDMTIQVQQLHPDGGQSSLTCMPVIRFPNFTDKTADVPIRKLQVLVGNEKKGEPLRAITLEQYLGNVRKYLSRPGSWKGDWTYLLAQRDTHVLVSAQACFLPVPKQGLAEFNPVLFNYPSRKGDPAVLAILATREGTSATVIDNERDRFQVPGGVWGQRLFHNLHGERCSLTGQRLSDFKEAGGQTTNTDPSKPTTPQAGNEAGLNMVLLIQVPLKQKSPVVHESVEPDSGGFKDKAAAKDPERKSDVEEAVIGHGKVEGEFTEMDGLDVERDPRFPIRVTVQFYKATSNGVVSAKDLDDIRGQIDRVYAEGDFVGSLVVGPNTGRPTEYDGDKVEPPDWWDKFWQDYHQRTGMTRGDVIQKLQAKHGPEWVPLTEHSLSVEAQDLARAFEPSPGLGRLLLWGGFAFGVVLAGCWALALRRRHALPSAG
jgi:hypothetical protein